MFEVECDICKAKNIIEISTDHKACHACGSVLKFKVENVFVNKSLENIKEEDEIYENGTIVTIINEEHPWNNDLAIIRGRKHKHHRVELHGVKIWVPNHWIKLNEPVDDDE